MIATITKVDMVVDLDHGDCGKGKISHCLLSEKKYNYVCKASGGNNAGHTIYHNNEKFITHYSPSGVFKNINSVICSGCVVHPESFLEEVGNLVSRGIPADKLLKIAYNAHLVTDEHIKEDVENNVVGSTGKGIAPAYRDKYNRTGHRVEKSKLLQPFLFDPIILHKASRILVEGSQGMWLCPDHGDYPYVTSSPPTSSYALHSLGMAPRNVGEVIGVCKPYSTYVGTKDFQPDGNIYKQIQDVGKEFGATTGRMRQVRELNLLKLYKAAQINGVDYIVINKMDVLREVNYWKLLIDKDKLIDRKNEDSFKEYIVQYMNKFEIKFSYSPNKI